MPASPTTEYGFGRVLGEGSFAHVIHARLKADGHDVAMKVMLKQHVEREGKTRAVMAERRALQRCVGCSQVVGLERTFQNEDYLFFVLEFASCGTLWNVIQRGVAAPHAAFYAAEIWLALEFIHGLGLAHRDVKPENVLVMADGHLKLADFGAVLDCTDVNPSESEDRTESFEGTAEYVSPEVLQGDPTTPACDLWALGVVIYQLKLQRLPFTAPTDFLLWELIIAFAENEQPEALDCTGLDDAAEHIVRAMLLKDASNRLGADDPLELRRHPFFASVDWEKPLQPPLLEGQCVLMHDLDTFEDFSIEYMLHLEHGCEQGGIIITESSTERGTDSGTTSSETSPPPPVIIDAPPPPPQPARRPSGGAYEAHRSSVARRRLSSYDFVGSVLEPGETVECTRILWKRKGFIWRERAFVLTSKPRLMYYDAHTAADFCKGEINWTFSKPVHCRRRTQNHFDLVTSHRDYHLASFDDGSDVWMDRVEATLNKQADDRLLTRSKEPVIEGFLWRQGRWPGLPKRRGAVLRGVQLFFYSVIGEAPSPREPLLKRSSSVLNWSGNSRAQPIGVVRCVRVSKAIGDATDRFGLDVEAQNGKVWKLFAETVEIRKRWLVALNTVIDAASQDQQPS